MKHHLWNLLHSLVPKYAGFGWSRLLNIYLLRTACSRLGGWVNNVVDYIFALTFLFLVVVAVVVCRNGGNFVFKNTDSPTTEKRAIVPPLRCRVKLSIRHLVMFITQLDCIHTDTILHVMYFYHNPFAPHCLHNDVSACSVYRKQMNVDWNWTEKEHEKKWNENEM